MPTSTGARSCAVHARWVRSAGMVMMAATCRLAYSWLARAGLVSW